MLVNGVALFAVQFGAGVFVADGAVPDVFVDAGAADGDGGWGAAGPVGEPSRVDAALDGGIAAGQGFTVQWGCPPWWGHWGWMRRSCQAVGVVRCHTQMHRRVTTAPGG